MSSGYHIPCLCGDTVISESRTATCPHCGRELYVETLAEAQARRDEQMRRAGLPREKADPQ